MTAYASASADPMNLHVLQAHARLTYSLVAVCRATFTIIGSKPNSTARFNVFSLSSSSMIRAWDISGDAPVAGTFAHTRTAVIKASMDMAAIRGHAGIQCVNFMISLLLCIFGNYADRVKIFFGQPKRFLFSF